jgi:hypothetical protein
MLSYVVSNLNCCFIVGRRFSYILVSMETAM